MLAYLVWAVYVLDPVYGKGGLESCHAAVDRANVEPSESVGRALAQIKTNAAKPVKVPTELSMNRSVSIEHPGIAGNNSSEKLARFEMTDSVTQRKPHHKPHHNSSNEPFEDQPLRDIPIPGMEDINEEHLEAEELTEIKLAQFVVIPIAVALLLSLFLGNLLEHFHLSWVPESAVTLLLGACVGGYMKYAIGNIALFRDEHLFNETLALLLTLFLLPILMFQSGWGLRKRDFASQVEYILLYAIAGSVISFLVVGLLILWTGKNDLHSIRYPRTAFAYASLIAATDPVATLSTYAALKVDPLLNILVFGDSTFNDAVAIVLFKVLNDDTIMGTLTSRPSLSELVHKIGFGIVKIFLGSLCLGVLSAFFFLLALRLFDMRSSPKAQIVALTAIAFITFAAVEVMHLSGIIATVFCSMILGIYARHHLSNAGSLLADFWLEQLGSIMDHMVFLLTGFCAIAMGTEDHSGFSFGLWAMLFCLIGRAASVYPMSWIANFFKRRVGMAAGKPEHDWHIVSSGSMFMMWHAALRGGISLTLCMQLGGWVDDLDGLGTRHTLQTATFWLICVFLLVFGGSTEVALKTLKIPMGEDAPRDKLYQEEVLLGAKAGISDFHDRVMMPLFVGDSKKSDYHRHMQSMDVEDYLKTTLKSNQRHI